MKILVVDDEPSICRPLKALLEHDGHDVEMAYSPIQAVALMGANVFDLALIDYVLGDNASMSGESVARHAHPITHVVLMTGYPHGFLAPLGYDVMVKPISHNDLRDMVAKVRRMREDTPKPRTPRR